MPKPEVTLVSELGGWLSHLCGSLSSTIGLVLLCVIVLFVAFKRRARVVVPGKSVGNAARAPNPKRPFGEWLPQSFTYPEFEASPHAPSEIKPPMYRPFRWGEYHVTMGIRSMHWGEWIELDDQYDVEVPIGTHIAYAYQCIGLVFLLGR
ncbi:hypothetical protein MVEN_01031400 [Mycena venus]|uniref:Uncharacterized protein n=1 Tax=Mycena venus TaxID=2733690 RepID=A0A8H6YDE5_9AGAR|nr:hypothetical protein MVEN_01031400 [Mycena venus]